MADFGSDSYTLRMKNTRMEKAQKEMSEFRLVFALMTLTISGISAWLWYKFGIQPETIIAFAALTLVYVLSINNYDSKLGYVGYARELCRGKIWVLWSNTWLYFERGLPSDDDLMQMPPRSYALTRSSDGSLFLLRNKQDAVQLRLTVE